MVKSCNGWFEFALRLNEAMYDTFRARWLPKSKFCIVKVYIAEAVRLGAHQHRGALENFKVKRMYIEIRRWAAAVWAISGANPTCGHFGVADGSRTGPGCRIGCAIAEDGAMVGTIVEFHWKCLDTETQWVQIVRVVLRFVHRISAGIHVLVRVCFACSAASAVLAEDCAFLIWNVCNPAEEPR